MNTDKAMEQKMTIDQIPFLAVTQPVGTFYLTSMKATLLLRLVDILSRDMTVEGQQRVQREYNEARGKAISKYAKEDNATFPTSIILAAYPDCVRIGDSTLSLGRVSPQNEVTAEDIWEPVSDTSTFKIGEIIDGQHRLLGLRKALKESETPDLLDFELPVVFMLDLDQSDKAYVFSTINSNQRSVSSSLIMDLFGLQESRSPQKTCHAIARAFYDWEGGPFQKGLKMLGKKTADGEMLSQGSFAKYIIPLISRRPDTDAKVLADGKETLPQDARCPLRPFFIDEKDVAIASILNEFFSAIRTEFPTEWSVAPDKYLLRKTVGFSALMKVFVEIWDPKKVTNKVTAAAYFSDQAKSFKKNIGPKELTSEIFTSSEKGARTMADTFLGKIK